MTATDAPSSQTSNKTSGGDAAPALKAAKQPVGAGFTPGVALVIALGVGALGVVGVQESLVRAGWISDTSWINQLLRQADGRSASFAMLVVFVLVALVGVWLLTLVLRRRPRKTLTVAAKTGVFLRTRDLADLAEATLRGTDGVIDLDVKTTRSKLSVTVHTIDPTSGNSELEQRVADRLAPLLGAIDSPPRLKLTFDNQELT